MGTNILIHKEPDGTLKFLAENTDECKLWEWAGERHLEYELQNLFVLKAAKLKQ